MAIRYGSITIRTAGLSPTVEITLAGSDATVYSDSACTSTTANPATISSDTTFYTKGTGSFLVSAKVNAVELLGTTVRVMPGTNTDLRCDANATALRSAFNTGEVLVTNSAAGTTLGTVVKKVEVFDGAGVSLGFVPVYDAIT